jgi:hypothetical protein
MSDSSEGGEGSGRVASVVAEGSGEVDGPARLSTPIARFRRHAMTCGPVPVRTWEASSAKVTSRTQCREGFPVQTANGLVQCAADHGPYRSLGSPATADSPWLWALAAGGNGCQARGGAEAVRDGGRLQPVRCAELAQAVRDNGLIALAGRQHPIGYHLAGRRITARLDHGVLHILDTDHTLLRSLPNPLTPAEQARLRDAWPAGPPSTPAAEPLRVERRVSCRGALMVAKQRVHVGLAHAGRTLTVEAADTTWRIYDHDRLVTEVARTTTKPVVRFKIHRPEPPRRRITLGS